MKLNAIIIIKVILVTLIITRITQYTKNEDHNHPYYADEYVIRTKDLVDCQLVNSQVAITIDNCGQFGRDEMLLLTGTTPQWLKNDPKSVKPVTVLETKAISSSQARMFRAKNWVDEKQADFRQSIMTSLTMVMPEEYATFSLLLVFGGSLSEFGQETKDVIVASGLAHVVAASGMNVAFVLVLAGMWSSQHRVFQVLWSSILVIGYALLAGGEPPVVRAALGAVLLVAGRYIWLRPGKPLCLLLASAALQLFISPQLITSISFQLSYAASFGILALFPLVNTHQSVRSLAKLDLNRSGNKTLITRVIDYIKTTLLITICCWVMVAPLLAYSFGTVTLTTIISGLLTTWLVPIVFVLSVATIVLGWLVQFFSPLQILLSAQAQLIMLLESFFFWTARFAASFDSLQKTWMPSLWQVVVWYVVILIGWWRLDRRQKMTSVALVL